MTISVSLILKVAVIGKCEYLIFKVNHRGWLFI